MAERTFKSYFDEWVITQHELLTCQHKVKNTFSIVGLKELKKRIAQLERKVTWHEDKMKTFGLGTIMQITGLIRIPLPSRSKVYTLKPFSILLANISEADAKEYFEKIVKLKYKNIEDKTIQFKQLPTGVISILH